MHSLEIATTGRLDPASVFKLSSSDLLSAKCQPECQDVSDNNADVYSLAKLSQTTGQTSYMMPNVWVVN